MTDIDVTTGLPVLEDGLFWRVVENDYPSFVFTRKYPGYSVQVCERVTVQWIAKVHLFLWFTRDDHRSEEQVIVHNSHTIFAENVDENGDLNALTMNQLTPADILRTARLLMEERARQLKAEQLLGDYPPKSLPTE